MPSTQSLPCSVPPLPMLYPAAQSEPLPVQATFEQAVLWACRRMPGPFSPADIIRVLARENYHLRPHQVAWAIKKLRARGQVETIQPARGRISPIFRTSAHSP